MEIEGLSQIPPRPTRKQASAIDKAGIECPR